jgi:hypothetical protein
MRWSCIKRHSADARHGHEVVLRLTRRVAWDGAGRSPAPHPPRGSAGARGDAAGMYLDDGLGEVELTGGQDERVVRPWIALAKLVVPPHEDAAVGRAHELRRDHRVELDEGVAGHACSAGAREPTGACDTTGAAVVGVGPEVRFAAVRWVLIAVRRGRRAWRFGQNEPRPPATSSKRDRQRYPLYVRRDHSLESQARPRQAARSSSVGLFDDQTRASPFGATHGSPRLARRWCRCPAGVGAGGARAVRK